MRLGPILRHLEVEHAHEKVERFNDRDRRLSHPRVVRCGVMWSASASTKHLDRFLDAPADPDTPTSAPAR